MQKRPIIVQAKLSTNYTLTGAYVSILGITMPYDGLVELNTKYTISYITSNSNASGLLKYQINATHSLTPSIWQRSSTLATVYTHVDTCILKEAFLEVKAGDVIYLQAYGIPQFATLSATSYPVVMTARYL